MVCTRVLIWMKCEIKLQNKWNEDEAQRECVRAPKYNNTANRRASATRWTRWKYNYGKVYYIKWNKREKGREMCTGSSAMRRGVAQCGERHEIVSLSNAARARAHHYVQCHTATHLFRISTWLRNLFGLTFWYILSLYLIQQTFQNLNIRYIIKLYIILHNPEAEQVWLAPLPQRQQARPIRESASMSAFRPCGIRSALN